MASNYKYKREDFGPLSVEILRLDIYLNFLEEYVEAENTLSLKALENMTVLELDAKDLEIIKIEWVGDEIVGDDHTSRLGFTYLKVDNKLVIELPRVVKSSETFKIRTLTRCVPSDNILEGIYKDVTPPGAPQQYMSQCQQWGFQRIMPIIDDCRAKCPMTTTLEGDSRYTHLISNGNICAQKVPETHGNNQGDFSHRQVVTYDNPIPMAPYLFIAVAGTWDTLSDTVTYDDGSMVRLEYLVPPGRVEGAGIPMEILKEAVLWISRTQGYKYSADTYRTICMTKSNFGGMENVGNTTIVTDAALIDEHTLDQSLIYAHGVIVHEFEHNQCGSETTMETPFDVWLNEAFTVDVERQFLADCFDPTFMRLLQVDAIRNPLLGPLAIEDSGVAGRIVREGFNDPDELIDGVTYVKAAEVIRMLRLVIGRDLFTKAKDLYFKRYHNSNANTDQFFQCFEEVSKLPLGQFMEGWLLRRGYPHVTANTTYDADRSECSIEFEQMVESDREPFHIPIEIALVDGKGANIPGTEKIFQLKGKTDKVVFENIGEEPAVVSINRGYSFYGAYKRLDATWDKLIKQAKLDTDQFNRVEAMREIADIQRIQLLEDPEVKISSSWLDLFGETLNDRSLQPGLRAQMLRIDEQPLDRRYSTWRKELVAARETMLAAINKTYKPLLVDKFHSIDTYKIPGSPKDGIEDRALKNLMLEFIAVDDQPDSHKLILGHLEKAIAATDKVAGLTLLNRTTAPERDEILEAYYEKWRDHVSGYANYLRAISSGSHKEVFEMIEKEKNRDTFDITHPTLSRALFLPMAMNSKMVWTDKGISWVEDTVVELSNINEYTTGRLLSVFQHARKLKQDLKQKVVKALEGIVERVPPDVSPSVNGQARSYLGL